jgi:hypothetical protein
MRFVSLLACLATAAAASVTAADHASDPLHAGFLNPPAEARPLVFWQWVNGNVTQEGIRLDLEWMQRVGLGGALWFDIGFRTPPVPQYVEKRVGFGTQSWQDAMRFASEESKRLGLLLGAQSGGGWSVSGGPQVTPEQAMKKLVWSETVVTPKSPQSQRLPMPPTVSGPYQDIAIDEPWREPTRYADVAVIAFRLPRVESAALPVTGAPDAAALIDGAHSRTTPLTPDARGEVTLQAEATRGAPRSLTLAVRGPLPSGVVEASADGESFVTIVDLPGPGPQFAPVRTFALGERDERHFRIRFTGLVKPLEIAEARFETGARIHLAQEKAGYGVLPNYTAAETTPVHDDAAIAPGDVLNVTSKMRPDGTLAWRPADGAWVVQRFGWTLTGRRNTPASAESLGLEVDKLDADAVRAFADAHYDRFPNPFDIALTDSWEAGQQNWTPAMFEAFARRNRYDLRRWMPVLTGRVVDNAARSERFLADFRRTIADLVADHHYGTLADVAHRRGMKYWAQAAGTDLPTLVDGLKAKSRADVPMGEFWFYPDGEAPQPNYLNDVREAVSAAHIYGKPVVAAEALTTRGEDAWAMGPPQLRRIVDRLFAEGINHIVLHTSVHQPFTPASNKGKPGMTLRQYGQHFTRNETWAEDAGDWVNYLARASWLLRQGHPVADVAIYIGDEGVLPPPDSTEELRRAGYAHDFINADALLSRGEIGEGLYVRPGGASYRVLAIAPQVTRMSPAVLARLRELTDAGVLLIGAPPVGGSRLSDDDAKVRSAAASIWNEAAESVDATDDIVEVLRRRKVAPDVRGGAALRWTHRKTGDGDVYFLANDSTQAFDGDVVFRVDRRRVEIWDAVDGSRTPAAHFNAEGSTSVRIRLEPRESRFLVFRGATSLGAHALPDAKRTDLSPLDGDWRVEFLDGQGAREKTLRAGDSWTDDADPAIRFYSGRVRYTRALEVPAKWLANRRRIELDLGTVGEIARVNVNGRDLGAWWSAPYRRDITDALRAGSNRLEITVTNYWINRLIGDEQPGAAKFTFAPIRPYTAESPLRRSGLLGPVKLIGVDARR